jgi:hypothetical protein
VLKNNKITGMLCIKLDGLRIRLASLSLASCECVISQVEILRPVLEYEHNDEHDKHCQKSNGWIEDEY